MARRESPHQLLPPATSSVLFFEKDGVLTYCGDMPIIVSMSARLTLSVAVVAYSS